MKPEMFRFLRMPLLAGAGLFGIAAGARAALSGTYTVNPFAAASATNYKSLKDIVSDLSIGTRGDGFAANGAGMAGPVVIEMADGAYLTNLIIPKIKGTSL